MQPISELHRRIAEKQVLVGAGIDSASPAMAEMAGMLGYDLVWGDLEHSAATSREAELFCMGAAAGGAWPLLRIQGLARTHILRALEAGARLVVAPMVESPEQAREFVEHGKYRPLGNRGFNGSARGLRYGIGDKLETMRWANRETHLFVQIETPAAVTRAAEIVGVDGITGGLVGPADLSVAAGKPLAFDDPEVLDLFSRAIRGIRSTGKIAAAAAGHPALINAARAAGIQILVCAGEWPGVRADFQRIQKEIAAMLEMPRAPGETV